MFAEFNVRRCEVSLVDLSKKISKEINQVTDILLENFLQNKELILNDPKHQYLILKHCPQVLRERYKERILTKLPEAHRIAILAAYIASHVVYNEGLGWLDSISEGSRFAAAMAYMKNDHMAGELIEIVEKSEIAMKEKVVAILEKSAARELTMINLDDVDFDLNSDSVKK